MLGTDYVLKAILYETEVQSNLYFVSVLGLDSGYTVNYNPYLQEFPQALPSGTPSGKGLYLTVYPFSCPNTDTVYSLAHCSMKLLSTCVCESTEPKSSPNSKILWYKYLSKC